MCVCVCVYIYIYIINKLGYSPLENVYTHSYFAFLPKLQNEICHTQHRAATKHRKPKLNTTVFPVLMFTMNE